MSEVPLKPMGKEEVRKLELALILGTIMRPDVIQKIRDAEDKVTWLDSLVVAAGALARERAGYPIERIAEELGRSESTIRNHLAGKTEAGKIVRETYEMLVKSGGKLELPILSQVGIDIEGLRKRVEKLEKEVSELRSKLEKVRTSLESLLREL